MAKRKKRPAPKRTQRRSPKNDKPKYQPLPDLPPDEFEALKADIDENGLQYPIIEDELGNCLDGHQRKRALKELGIKNYSVKVIAGLSEEQKWHYSISVNLKRRQLTTPQKRTLIENELKRSPEIANNWLAEILGVAQNTVVVARKRLEAKRIIRKHTKLRGKDGKKRSTNYHVIANTPNELRIAREIINDLPASCGGKTLDAVTASRRARKNLRQRTWKGKLVTPTAEDDLRLFHCRFQRLEKVANISPKSVNLVLTDIPYGKEFLPQLDALGAFVNRVLVNGGLFVTFSGQYYLDRCLQAFGKHLTYRWTLAGIWDGDGNVVFPLSLASQWKPILLYSKGKWTKKERWPDLIRMHGKEKKWHDHQQPLDAVEMLVELFARPGELVVDTCGGGFTTAVACRNLGRRFIGCDVDKQCVAKGQKRLAGSMKKAA
ncbi:MAG: ParB N-terminal domain-containing protein [Candidatus Nealsonbacteria bacterium]|nr:ParB N-terminal domain-containing protein [Candidatus Nealsonbacteria bacterium]